MARIGYDADLKRTLHVLEQLLRDEPRVLEEPAPNVYVSSLDESGIELTVRGWVKSEDWWSLHSALRALVRLKLAEEEIEMPARRYKQVSGRESEPSKGPGSTDPTGS